MLLQKIKYLFIIVILSMYGCEKDTPNINPPPKINLKSASFGLNDNIDNDVALQWSKMTLYIAKNTKGNTPTYASRGFGYIGLTMYESIVKGSAQYRSLEGQLNGNLKFAQPDTTLNYNWILSLNAGQSYILKKIYEFTTVENIAKIDSLEKVIFDKYSTKDSLTIAIRSEKYGRAVAEKVYEWSTTDGGDKGYLRNLPVDYTIPTGPGFWEPASFSQVPTTLTSSLHPTWGNNRTFLRANQELAIPKALKYSKELNSDYYAQMLSVRNKKLNLTLEEKEIAAWWGDDPSLTFTPPGHSYNIAKIAVTQSEAKLFKSAQSFAAVGISIADAFINCWKCKYVYNAERPSTYIQTFIDGMWISFFPEPPFPAFPSGHATQGSACAAVLTQIYGNQFSFIDNSHENREVDPVVGVDFKNRSFHSFWEAAEESAYSRFLGGIHTAHDNVTGLVEGRKIGNNVNKLNWKN